MKPYSIYISDLFNRGLYLLVSYILCLGVFFYNIETLFLLEVYPLLSLADKRFITTSLTDFIDVIWSLSVFTSTLFFFPLCAYHVISFFYNSWYIYQINLYKKLVIIILPIFFVGLPFVHYVLFPNIFNFFVYWEINEETSLLRIETEITLVSYVIWTITFKSIFYFFLMFLMFSTINFLYFIKLKRLYKFIKINKNLLVFFLIFSSFLATPPDFFVQLFTITINFLICDILFFFVCVKFYKNNCIQNKK